MQELVYVMEKETCVAKIIVDGATVEVVNYTDDLILRPFGLNVAPTYKDFIEFLKDRCVPEQRAGLSEALKEWGLPCYNPYDIVRKTHGVMFEDYIWLKFGDEDKTEYKAIALRK